MEAVWKIEVEDFPAFIVINHEGKDFYADLDAKKAAELIQVRAQGKK
jgi:fumarate hydratase class I